MLLKKATLKIEAVDTVSNYIDKDFLLRGPKKTAFKKHQIGSNLIKANNSINLVAELEKKNPEEWVIFRARAIDAGGLEKTGETLWGENDNGDYFSEEELLSTLEGTDKKSFETFIGVPVFVNHKNDNVEEARGRIVNAFYDVDNHCVWVDGMIDAKAYPELGRAVREGYVSDVSMGCSVKYSECSYCGNKAENEDSYCTHVKNSKGRKVHGQKIYEKNHGIKFIELSAVVDGACENCTIHNVFTGSEFLEQVNSMCKVASKQKNYTISDKNNIKLVSHKLSCSNKKIKALKSASINVVARAEDIDKLNKALDLLKEVSKQILESKDVDYEFLADIGDLLSELQYFIIDLVESGFANTEQGGGVSDKDVTEAISDTTGGPESVEQTTPTAPPATPSPSPSPPSAGIPPATQTPLANNSNEKIKKFADNVKEFKEVFSELQKMIDNSNNKNLRDNMPTQKEIERSRIASSLTEKLANSVVIGEEPLVYHDGDYTALVNNNGITVLASNKKVAYYSNENLGSEILEELKKDPKKIASNLLNHISKKLEGDKKMEKITKEALAKNPPPVEEIQEGQLEGLDGNFGRKNDEIGVTTEAQLEKVPKSNETGKGDFGRIRPENGKVENLEITEGQLSGKTPTKFGSERSESDRSVIEGQHSGTQEYQLSQSGFGSERWDNDSADADRPTTEAQFEGKDRSGKASAEISEGQLESYRQGKDKVSGSDNNGKFAKNYSDKVITAFVNGLANAVNDFNISPKTIASVKPSSEKIKTANVSLKNIGKEITKENISHIASYCIARSIGVNQKLASSYIDDAIDVLYEDKEKLASAIKEKIEERIAEIQRVASGKDTVKTVSSSLRNSWNKRTAAPIEQKSYVFTLGELLNSFPENQRPTIDGKSINNHRDLVKQYLNSENLQIASISMDDRGLITVNGTEVSNQPTSENNSSAKSVETSPNTLSLSNAISSESSPSTQDSGSEQVSEPLAMSASAKKSLQRLAQSPSGTTLPPPAGAMGGPAGQGAPAGGIQSLDAPGGEEPPVDESLPQDGEDEFESEESQAEAKPFGAISPITGSDDVDYVDGVYKDNSSGIEYTVDVSYKILNPNVIKNPTFMKGNDESAPAEESAPEGGELNDELNASPAGMEAPAIPGAKPAGGPGGAGGAGGLGAGASGKPSWTKTASLRYDIVMDPMLFDCDAVEAKVDGKIVRQAIYKPGHICPQCGTNRVAFKSNEGECANCGCKTYVETKKTENGKLNVFMTVDPNLEVRAEKNEFGGHAFNASVANRKDLEEKIHQILSSRQSLIKIASKLPDDPWLNCVSDQVADGFDGDNSIQICASLKSAYLKNAGIEEEDDDLIEKESDKTEFEEDINDKEEGSEEVDSDENSEESDDVEDGFEEVTDEEDDFEVEESDDQNELEDENVIDDVEDEIGAGAKVSEEVPVENITEISLSGTTATGDEFEVKIPVNTGVSSDVSPEGGDDLFEIEEVFEGDVDDVKDLMNSESNGEEEGETMEHEMGETPEEEVEEHEGDGDEEVGLKDIFTMPEDPNEEEQEEKIPSVHKSEDHKIVSASLKLRSGLVKKANTHSETSIFSDYSFEKLAQAIGMPLSVDAEERIGIPRNEKEDGIREDGDVAETTEYENTAKDMKGTKDGNAAGSTISKDPVVSGAERGVSQIKPAEVKASGKKKWIIASEENGKEKKEDGKFPEEKFPNDKGKKECCGPTGTGNNSKKSDEKRTKVHFKDETKIETKVKGSNPFTKKEAQNNSAKQSEPVDAISGDKVESNSVEKSLNIPTDKSKSVPQEIDVKRKDVKNPVEIRKTDYNMGDEGKNLHTDVIPRDGSGDGIGGKKVSFEKEIATDATSGNPDTYVQKFQDKNQIAPTPAGNELNHAVASDTSKAIRHFAKIKGIDECNLEAVNFGNGIIAIEDIRTGKIYEVKKK